MSEKSRAEEMSPREMELNERIDQIKELISELGVFSKKDNTDMWSGVTAYENYCIRDGKSDEEFSKMNANKEWFPVIKNLALLHSQAFKEREKKQSIEQ